ncbi:MAG: deoxyribodipyrimidine photo-lyase [Candidatus Bathyarchaeia archaeon]
MSDLPDERLNRLNTVDMKKGRGFVLYWMQTSVRTQCNMAFDHAVWWANQLDKPLVAFFGLTPDFPEANLRHYTFLLEGLHEVKAALAEFGVQLVVQRGSPERGVVSIAKNACIVVVDKGYLKPLRQWYRYAADRLSCPLVQVEDNVVVPVEAASSKEEYSAATLRPKIQKNRSRFLSVPTTRQPKHGSLDLPFDTLDLRRIDTIISDLGVDTSVDKAVGFRGGTQQAQSCIAEFLEHKLPDYPQQRNDPTVDFASNLSPYLHFGQISPVDVAAQVLAADAPAEAKQAYIEELVVRRELAINYAWFNPDYDGFDGLSNWAKQTLHKHEADKREYLYDVAELENAQTHDPYWNAAQTQMRVTGKMHGYMRMYWGKKILEWTKTPREAFKAAIYLNNKYELDGRDPNGYTGVAWCLGKHDRPWRERPIYGTARYMNANGLKRKFDADKYVQQIKQL